jgi:hypothetical protein
LIQGRLTEIGLQITTIKLQLQTEVLMAASHSSPRHLDDSIYATDNLFRFGPRNAALAVDNFIPHFQPFKD